MMDVSTLTSKEFLPVIQRHEACLTVFAIKQLSIVIVIVVCETIES